MQHRDIVRESECLRLIMRDIHHRGATVAGQRRDLHSKPLPKVGVQIRQRLVEQEQAGPRNHGASQPDPLLLAA